MKKLIQGASTIFVAVLLSFTGASAALAVDFPVPPAPSLESPIVDTSNTLSADQINQIAAAINNDKTAGKRQLAVLVVDSLNGAVIEEASLAVARKWGIGETGNNNGVLLMVAVKDRSMRIEVGTGLEGVLPDIRTKQISDNYITPAFKEGDYFTGIRDGVVQIDAAVAGEKFESKPSELSSNFYFVVFLIVFIVVVLSILSAGKRLKKGKKDHKDKDDKTGLFTRFWLASLTWGDSGRTTSFRSSSNRSSKRSSGNSSSGGSSGGSSSSSSGSKFGGGGFGGGGSSSRW